MMLTACWLTLGTTFSPLCPRLGQPIQEANYTGDSVSRASGDGCIATSLATGNSREAVGLAKNGIFVYRIGVRSAPIKMAPRAYRAPGPCSSTCEGGDEDMVIVRHRHHRVKRSSATQRNGSSPPRKRRVVVKRLNTEGQSKEAAAPGKKVVVKQPSANASFPKDAPRPRPSSSTQELTPGALSPAARRHLEQCDDLWKRLTPRRTAGTYILRAIVSARQTVSRHSLCASSSTGIATRSERKAIIPGRRIRCGYWDPVSKRWEYARGYTDWAHDIGSSSHRVFTAIKELGERNIT